MRLDPRRRIDEIAHQFVIPLARIGHRLLLHRTITANAVGQRQQLDRGVDALRRQLVEQERDILLIPRDQIAFEAAVGGIAEHIQRRAAQHPQLCEQTEAFHHRGTKDPLARTSQRVLAAAEQGRCQVEVQGEVALELVADALLELAVGEQTRNLVLVLVGEQLGVVDGHRTRQLLAEPRAGGRGLDALDQIAIARGKLLVLVVAQQRAAVVDDLDQRHLVQGFRRHRLVLEHGMQPGRIDGRQPPQRERQPVHLDGDAVEFDGLVDRLGRHRQQALLIGVAQHHHVGGDRIPEQAFGRMGEVEEDGILAQRALQHPVDLAALEIKIPVANEIGDRDQMGVDDAVGALRLAERNGLLGDGDHLVGGDQEIGGAGNDARAGDVLGVLRNPDMAEHRAALLRQPRHVEDHAGLAFDMRGHAEQRADGQHTGTADTAHRNVVGPVERLQRGRRRQFADGAEIDRGLLAQLAAVDGDERRAEALDAGEVLVAARLVDRPLAAERGFQGLDRDAVRLHRAVAAAFADRGIDDDALRRIHQRAAFAAAALLGRAGLHEHDRRTAGCLAQGAHDVVEFVAMGNLHARRDDRRRIAVGILRDQVDLAHALAVQLEGDLLRRQVAVMALAAGHGDRVVVEHLVSNVGLGRDRLADRQAAGMEISAVAEIGEDVLLVGERRNAGPRHALAAHLGEGLGAAVHPQRHEVAADAGHGAAALRHLGGGVVRTAGAEVRRAGDRRHRLHLRGLPAVEPVGLGAQHGDDLGIEIQRQQALGQRGRDGGDAQFLGERQEALVVMVHLADDAGPHVITPVEQLLLDLILDDLAALLDHQDLFKTDGEVAHALRLQRPRHADLVEPQADLGCDLRRDAELAQRLAHVLITLAGRHDAVTGVRRIHGDAVDLVGARERDRGKALVVLQPAVLGVAVVRPAQVQSIRRQLEIRRDDEGRHLVGQIDLGGGLHRFGDHLHADPAAGIARHRNAEQSHLDHFMDAGGIEIGHQRRDEGMVGLMRHGGGFRAVVVAGKAQHAAVLGRSRRIAVAEHVAAAVDARPLAVPDPNHAIFPGARGEIELLRPPDRGGGQVLVDARLEFDVVLRQMRLRGHQLLVVAAERRSAVTGDEGGGVQSLGAIPSNLRHRQPHQGLDARHENVARPLGILLVEADRPLIDSHRDVSFLLLFWLVFLPAVSARASPFRTSLCRFCSPLHQESEPASPLGNKRNFVPTGAATVGAYVAGAPGREQKIRARPWCSAVTLSLHAQPWASGTMSSRTRNRSASRNGLRSTAL